MSVPALALVGSSSEPQWLSRVPDGGFVYHHDPRALCQAVGLAPTSEVLRTLRMRVIGSEDSRRTQEWHFSPDLKRGEIFIISSHPFGVVTWFSGRGMPFGKRLMLAKEVRAGAFLDHPLATGLPRVVIERGLQRQVWVRLSEVSVRAQMLPFVMVARYFRFTRPRDPTLEVVVADHPSHIRHQAIRPRYFLTANRAVEYVSRQNPRRLFVRLGWAHTVLRLRELGYEGDLVPPPRRNPRR